MALSTPSVNIRNLVASHQPCFVLNIQGLPKYVSKYRKTKTGYEIQNAAHGSSGVILRLKLAKQLIFINVSTNKNGMLHGAYVFMQPVKEKNTIE